MQEYRIQDFRMPHSRPLKKKKLIEKNLKDPPKQQTLKYKIKLNKKEPQSANTSYIQKKEIFLLGRSKWEVYEYIETVKHCSEWSTHSNIW